MPDEPELEPAGLQSAGGLTAGGVVQGAAMLRGEGRLIAGSTIRAAVQELHDSSREELVRLLAQMAKSSGGTVTLRSNADGAAMADAAETSRMPSLAKLVRAAAKFGVTSILAAIIAGPVTNSESDLFGWTPPSVTVVRQMSPRQLDELARQIGRQMEQWEREHDRSAGHDHD